MVKQEHKAHATQLFADTDVHIAIHGKRHLGAALGFKTFTETALQGPLLSKGNMNAKKKQKKTRLWAVEHRVFTPLVFSNIGRMGQEATSFYNGLQL